MAATGSLLRPDLGALLPGATRLVRLAAGSATIPLGVLRSALGRSGWICRVRGSANDHFGALAQLVGAVDHDAIAGRNSRNHLDAVAVGDAELDRPHRDGAVGIDEIDEGAGN